MAASSTPLLDAMLRALGDGKNRMIDHTHWNMTEEALVRLRCEVKPNPTVEDFKSTQDKFMGLPIYVNNDMPEPGWGLMTGSVRPPGSPEPSCGREP